MTGTTAGAIDKSKATEDEEDAAAPSPSIISLHFLMQSFSSPLLSSRLLFASFAINSQKLLKSCGCLT